MKSLTLSDFLNVGRQTIALSLIVFIALLSVYVFAEPVVTRAVTDQFVITQQVTSEISFVATASDITMGGSIPGITGGTASGSTQVRVYTNDSAGYNMTIAASGSPAMQGAGQGGTIRDFSTTTTGYMSEPSFAFTVPANSAGFGYSVSASTTADLDQSFQDNGTLCNQASGSETATGMDCWIGASTTAFTIINRNSETAASGATTTLFFRTTIMSSPAPSIPEDFYYATTTLTAVTN